MSVDPHSDHYLEEGPVSLGWKWAGVCRCGQQFRGITRDDIYTKAQLHINRHNNPYGDEDGAA